MLLCLKVGAAGSVHSMNSPFLKGAEIFRKSYKGRGQDFFCKNGGAYL